jgi:hypothetical protein
MYLLTKRDNSVAQKGSADISPKESPAEQIEALRTFLGYPKLEQKFIAGIKVAARTSEAGYFTCGA